MLNIGFSGSRVESHCLYSAKLPGVTQYKYNENELTHKQVYLETTQVYHTDEPKADYLKSLFVDLKAGTQQSPALCCGIGCILSHTGTSLYHNINIHTNKRTSDGC